MAEEKVYHFSCGNSTDKSVGFCASVIATSEQEATDRLCVALFVMVPVHMAEYTTDPHILDVTVYFGAAAVTKRDIDRIDNVPTTKERSDDGS